MKSFLSDCRPAASPSALRPVDELRSSRSGPKGSAESEAFGGPPGPERRRGEQGGGRLHPSVTP
jgi:hypothetical protein